MELDKVVYATIAVADERLPLHFELEEETEGAGCLLRVQGLSDMTILDAYGLVLAEGKLLRETPEACARLLELQELLGRSVEPEQLPLPPAQIEPFMERVMPAC